MRSRTKRGQSLVEMAMIAPILIMMLVSVIDFGRAAYDYSTLSAAVREGARQAALTGSTRSTNADVVAAVKRYAVGLSLAPASCVNGAYAGSSWPPSTPSSAAPNTGVIYIVSGSSSSAGINAPGGQASAPAAGSCAAVNPADAARYPLTIKVVYKFQPLTPFVQQFLGSGSVTLTVASTMTTEY
ncbi:MAG: TadE family protein [Candidatus Dormibacter sp.]